MIVIPINSPVTIILAYKYLLRPQEASGVVISFLSHIFIDMEVCAIFKLNDVICEKNVLFLTPSKDL